jgi:hypothetical protein
MFDEMKFLFNTNNKVYNNYKDTTNNKNFSQNNDSVLDTKYDYDYNVGTKNYEKLYKALRRSDIKNYIKSSVNSPYVNNVNPYMKLIEDFNSGSKIIKPSDLVYLRDIGVYPLNKMFVLRRFNKGVYIRNDLDLMNAKPISTIVGWIKDEKEFLKFSFGENWIKQGSDKMIHKLLTDILSNEFGIKLNELIPIPGWGLGFIFGILNSMKLTKFDAKNLPIGNPNLLMESITRDHENFGLNSSFSFNLETVYEQKYINGIDPNYEVMTLLKNVLSMGSSNVEYLGNIGSDIINDLRNASNNPSNPTAWVTFISKFVAKFIEGVEGQVKTISNQMSNLKNNKEITDKTDKNVEITNNTTSLISSNMDSIGTSILASTVARYAWPLRGSIGMLTGEATTPWHLTLGNPYAPLLSMSNVYLKNVDVSFSGDMLYNDIPKFINVSLSLEQGRNMGKNEIYNMLGIKYQRSYTKVSNSDFINSETITKPNISEGDDEFKIPPKTDI